MAAHDSPRACCATPPARATPPALTPPLPAPLAGTNFVQKMLAMLREHREQHGRNASAPPLRFYLAADSEDAYEGLTRRFPGLLVYTRRECAAKRCDFRDCRSVARATCNHTILACCAHTC